MTEKKNDLTLWLIRHAKSSWANTAQTDFDRPLNKRGNADGPHMANWLAEQSNSASWIWTSDAARALATAEYVTRGFAASEPQLIEDHRLYHAAPETICDLLRETPAAVRNAALVAHNPGLTYLVNRLAGQNVIDNLPTFGIARFNISGTWAELTVGRATLNLVMTPKLLP